MRKKEATILIVDDDDDILFSARISLKKYFTEIITANNPKKISNHLTSSTHIDVVLLDMNYRIGYEDGKEGLYWLKHIKEISPETTVLLMTAFGSVNLAVEAIKKGATDFILKPWNTERLYGIVNSGIELSRSKRKTTQLQTVQKLNDKDFHQQTEHIIGTSPAMKSAVGLAQKVAPTDATILILGENGTGKYVFAKEIHLKSERKNHPFIHVDLGSLNENLFESELFGHVKGAFTDARTDRPGRFEIASGGTLFLDEIGNLSLPMQAKLLTVLERREVIRVGSNKPIPIDIRLICATNMPILQMVAEENYRQDLLYRINTVEISLPALGERYEDIPLLAEHFLQIYAKKYKKSFGPLSKACINKLYDYSWPGNVRELQHLMERAVIMADDNNLQPSDFQINPGHSQQGDVELDSYNLEEVEKNIIQKVLKTNQGNISKAAGELGLTRTSLYRRLEKYGL